jgi:hypothetical protein
MSEIMSTFTVHWKKCTWKETDTISRTWTCPLIFLQKNHTFLPVLYELSNPTATEVCCIATQPSTHGFLDCWPLMWSFRDPGQVEVSLRAKSELYDGHGSTCDVRLAVWGCTEGWQSLSLGAFHELRIAVFWASECSQTHFHETFRMYGCAPSCSS